MAVAQHVNAAIVTPMNPQLMAIDVNITIRTTLDIHRGHARSKCDSTVDCILNAAASYGERSRENRAAAVADV